MSAPPPSPFAGAGITVDNTTYDISSYPPASFSTIVNYLVGITVGTVLFSLLLIALLSAPALLAKTAAARRLVLRTVSRARAHVVEAGEAGVDLVASGLAGGGSHRPAAAAAAAEEERAKPAAAAGAEPGTPAPPAAPGSDGGSGSDSDLDELEEEVGDAERRATLRLMFIWLFTGVALLVAAIVTIAVGTAAMRNTVLQNIDNSLIDLFTNLIIGVLCGVGFCDLVGLAVAVALRPHRALLGRGAGFKRAQLGWRAWAHRHARPMHLAAIAAATVVVSVSAVVFSLGVVLVIGQLSVRIACYDLFTQLSVPGVSGATLAATCVSLPFLGLDNVCGSDILSLCYDVTGLGVLNLVLGSALLSWSHLVWLVALVAVGAKAEVAVRKAVLVRSG